MELLNKLERVAQLFKPTFCRDFIVYGSNVICCRSNCLDIAKTYNEGLYDEVELIFNLNDFVARCLNPAYKFAFPVTYEVNGFKFYMCTYWQFMVILAANDAYKLNQYFRYPADVDKLHGYMYTCRCSETYIYRWCTLLFGDALNLMSRVGVIVDSIYQASSEQVDRWVAGRWVSLQDLPPDKLRNLDRTFKSMNQSIRDLSFMTRQFSAYTVEAGTIADAVEIYDKFMMNFHEDISNLPEN